MRFARCSHLWLSLACLAANMALIHVARAQEVEPDQFRPRWQVGQKWEVETVSLQSQVRKTPAATPPSKPVRWQFEVEAEESVEGRECYRIALRCLEPGEHPETVIWVDRGSLTLRQIRMQLPGLDGMNAVTETYRSSSDQPFPTVSALTVPPLDLPLFTAGAKGPASFEYRASSSPEGAKDAGDLDFSVSIEQQLVQPQEEDLQQWLPEQFAKSAANAAVVEVRLKTGRSQVRQLWQKGSPWPIYSTNGLAVARLVPPQPATVAPNE